MNLSLLYCFFLVITAGRSYATDCTSGYTLAGSHCYRISPSRLSWYHAQEVTNSCNESLAPQKAKHHSKNSNLYHRKMKRNIFVAFFQGK